MLVNPSRARNRLVRAIEASIRAHQALLERSLPELEAIARCLLVALRGDNKVLLCGNGGSAADAQHVAAELVGRFAMDSKPFAAIALTTDTSVLTAVANDWDYSRVFERQVRALARQGDVVVGISTSGNSENVALALRAARAAGARTVAVTGPELGRLAPYAELCFKAPGDCTARVQELHLLGWHGICELVEAELSSAREPELDSGSFPISEGDVLSLADESLSETGT